MCRAPPRGYTASGRGDCPSLVGSDSESCSESDSESDDESVSESDGAGDGAATPDPPASEQDNKEARLSGEAVAQQLRQRSRDRLCRVRLASASQAPDGSSEEGFDEIDDATASVGEHGDDQQELNVALGEMLDRATQAGATPAVRQRLANIVEEHRDVFRTRLGDDPPANVPPMEVEMMEEAELPRRHGARRFSPLQQELYERDEGGKGKAGHD